MRKRTLRHAGYVRNYLLGCMGLFLLVGCATTPPPLPPAEQLRLTIQAVKSGQTTPSMESAYDFISALKSSEHITIIYDASGSMLWPTAAGGAPRYKHAYLSLAKYVKGMKAKNHVGLIVYGSRYPSGIFDGKVYNLTAAKKSCMEDIAITVPLGQFRMESFQSELERLSQSKSYRGDTPIGGAVLAGVDLLKGVPGERKHIILITDGIEECYSEKGLPNGIPDAVSPEDAVKRATELGITVSIVGYGIGHGKDGKMASNAKQALDSLKSMATGVFVVANTGEELLLALMQVEVENFKFDLLDQDGRNLGKFRIGETINVNMTSYNPPKQEPEKSGMGKFITQIKEKGGMILKKDEPVASPKPIKTKFTIQATGDRIFEKSFGVTPDMEDVTLFLGLKSATDTDPDIAPENLKWED